MSKAVDSPCLVLVLDTHEGRMRQPTVQYCNVAPKSDTQTAKNTPNDVQRLSILSVASWRFSKIRSEF